VRLVPAAAVRAWFTPPHLPASVARRDAAAVEGLEPTVVTLPEGTFSGYSVGDGPLVLALHGWGGRAAQWVPMAQRLAGEGYRVTALDLPGHAGGSRTDLGAVAAAVRGLGHELGRPGVVLGHSFGCLVARVAFSTEPPQVMVMVAPAIDARAAVDMFATRLRLAPWTHRGLVRRLEAWNPQLWATISDIGAGQLPGADVLIVHDPADADTPFGDAARLGALRPGTTLLPTHGLGHNKPLSDPATLDHVARFVVDRVRANR
jgi:pimeloyl-ACP methyl ester carboxylesterase